MTVKSDKAQPLVEIGLKIQVKGSSIVSKDALLRMLKTAAGLLLEVEQSANSSIAKSIKPFVQALSNPRYLDHKDKDVRLLVAFCCSEAMRIYAPDPPYSDPQLKAIFHLFVAIFHRLDDVKSPSFQRIVAILEILSKVRTCLVMLDLDLHDLIEEMFQIFFRSASESHPPSALTAMADVMSIILEESEEIPQKLLTIVTSNLLPPSTAGSTVARAVIQKSADALKGPILRLFTSSLHSEQQQQQEADSSHGLMLEVYKAAPQLMITILPTTIDDLRKEDVGVRLRAVQFLGEIFAIPGGSASHDYRQLYAEFLKRFLDISVEVRQKMLEWAEAILLAGTSPHSAPEIMGLCVERLMDIDDRVRLQVVKIVCHLAWARPEVVSADNLRLVSDRIRDKKVSLRRLVLPELFKVYRQYCTRRQAGNEPFSRDFEWIPAKVLTACNDPEVKDFKFQNFDLLFEDQIFPPKVLTENRALHWVHFFEFVDGKAEGVVKNLFKMKSHVQQEIKKYLDLRKAIKEEDSPDLQSQLEATFASLAACFPDASKAEEQLRKAHLLKDNNIFKLMAALLDPSSDPDLSQATKEDLLKRLGEKHPLHDFMGQLASKMSFSLFGRYHVGAVVQWVKDEKERDSKLLASGIRLLIEVSVHFPALFEEFQAQLVVMLNDDRDLVKDGAAAILSKAGKHLRDVLPQTSSSIGETLQSLAVAGSRSLAKHAVAAIASLSADSGQKELSRLYNKLVDSLGNEEMLPAVFQSLGAIAQHALHVFETREDEIIKFVVRNVLRRRSELYVKNESTRSKFDWDSPSRVCQLKVQGLKVLVKSFLPLKESPARHRLRGLLNVLEKLVPLGELNDSLALESTEVDRAHIRLAAAKSVLQLARKYESYMQSQTPNLFLTTILTVQDPCLQVRQKLVSKVHQLLHLRERALPAKYACAFVLDCIDADKANVALSKRHLAEFIDSCRREATARQARALSGGSDASLAASLLYHPEYVLVYLVHVLAHHPDFPEASEEDARLFEPFKTQIQTFVRALMSSELDGKVEEADSLPAILAILRTVKNSPEDAVDSCKTEKVYCVCDIGIFVAKELGRKRLFSGEFPGAVPLPIALFKPLLGSPPDLSERIDGSHLPKCLTALPQRAKAKQTVHIAKNVTSKSRKRHSAGTDEEGSDEDDEEEDKSDWTHDDDTSKPPKGSPTSKKMKSDRSTRLRDRSAAIEASRKESPARLPTRSKSARVPPPEKVLPLGAGLIGRKVKVWWPMDKAFYEGVITQYDERKKSHHIEYEDGDEELLNLAKEEWQFVDEDEEGQRIPVQPGSSKRQSHPKSRPKPPSESRRTTRTKRGPGGSEHLQGTTQNSTSRTVSRKGSDPHSSFDFTENSDQPEGAAHSFSPPESSQNLPQSLPDNQRVTRRRSYLAKVGAVPVVTAGGSRKSKGAAAAQRSNGGTAGKSGDVGEEAASLEEQQTAIVKKLKEDADKEEVAGAEATDMAGTKETGGIEELQETAMAVEERTGLVEEKQMAAAESTGKAVAEASDGEEALDTVRSRRRRVVK